MKKIYGEYKGDFLVPNSRIYIGLKDGVEFAQMSFLSMGQMHSNFDEIKFINDEEATFVIITSGYKMDVICRLINNNLNIHIDIMDDKSIDYVLNKISNDAKYEDEFFCIPEDNFKFLKENNEYINDDLNINIEYELNNEEVLKFLDLKGFERIKDKSFNSILKLYKKLCELYTQNGMNYVHSKELGTIAQIRQAEKNNGFTNCRGISIILSGILRANGIKAFYEGLFPFNLNDNECHIVCELFVEEFNKFILFDPSLCTIYKLDGIYLNSIDIKNAIINKRENDIIIEYINDKKKKNNNLDTLSYYSKNLGHLERCIINSEKTDTSLDNALILSPLSLKEDKIKSGIVTTDILKYFK